MIDQKIIEKMKEDCSINHLESKSQQWLKEGIRRKKHVIKLRRIQYTGSIFCIMLGLFFFSNINYPQENTITKSNITKKSSKEESQLFDEWEAFLVESPDFNEDFIVFNKQDDFWENSFLFIEE